MTLESARRSIVTASLTLSGVILVFFLLASSVGYPITFGQSIRILQVVLPVFAGYLGSATIFVFRPTKRAYSKKPVHVSPLIAILVRGPIAICAMAFLSLIVAFGLSNSETAAAGSGITLDELSAGLTLILGLQAGTTGVAVNYLFNNENVNPDRQGAG